MSDQPQPRRSRRATAILVAVLVLVIAAVAVIGVLTSQGGAKPGTAAPTGVTDPSAAPVATATTTPPRVDPTRTPKPVKRTAAPTPQPTRTATIDRSTAVAIKKELSARVVKMESVTGTADGPGEIGGPSVRFTIAISNTTGKAFTLSNTVVNAYYGKSATPAVPLRQPGGKDFPSSVKDGGTATGVFVFNIPKAQRGSVRITVDTAVQNPVIAFQGAAPRS